MEIEILIIKSLKYKWGRELGVEIKKGHLAMTFCVQAGIRTQDPILKRDVLYLLSYLNILRYWDCKNTINSLTKIQKVTFFLK